MIRELYCKLPTDLDYILQIESTDEAYNILQQVKVILGTKEGEILGSPTFGFDISEFLFQMNYDQEQIIKKLNNHLAAYLVYDRTKYQVTADVKFGHNHNDPYDYALVDININQKKCMGIIVNQQ